MQRKHWLIVALGFLAFFLISLTPDLFQSADIRPPRLYIVQAWNNLGMHCYNNDSKDLMILPPYNTLDAQVIRVGDPPQIITRNIIIKYNFPQNTYSANKYCYPNKTNFWTYVNKLFGINLPPNVGLAGKSLAGVMDLKGDYFEAEGIPLTEYNDNRYPPSPDPATWTRYPYQLANVKVYDAVTCAELASNIVVAPVSSELMCSMCHVDDGYGTTAYPITPTGKVDTNILALHDYLNAGLYSKPLMECRPVLCASCHGDNALGKPGISGISSLSNAMHNHHKNLTDITPDTKGCYNCHPGEKTQCLRDTMSTKFSFNCVTCHGTMADVAANSNPWLNEPRCDNVACHGPGYALDQPLYRNSKGHGGVYCAACHDSPHAQAPSRETNDSIKFVFLSARIGKYEEYTVPGISQPSAAIQQQTAAFGSPAVLHDCTVCHLTKPDKPFVHAHVPK